MANFEKYKEFVDTVTSNPSKNHTSFSQRLNGLHAMGCPIERLLTGAVGMSAESGEFMEIVKKIIFQGKEFTEDNIRNACKVHQATTRDHVIGVISSARVIHFDCWCIVGLCSIRTIVSMA